MGHNIRAIIGKNNVIRNIADDWINAKAIELPQGYAMIFLTDMLFDDIIELSREKNELDNSILTYFATPLVHLLQHYSFRSQLVYIETDYFGSYGNQAGVLFENEKISISPKCSNEIINQLLSAIGVWKEQGKDEFDSLGLGNHRRM